MLKDIAGCLWWLVILVVKAVVILVGLVWVPFCLRGVPIPKTPYKWRLIRLPWYGHPWDNPRDGVLGDRRLDYWSSGTQYPLWFDKLRSPQYIKAYYWLAVRNPANNLSRFYRGFGCKVDECQVTLLAGDYFVSDVKDCEGWQFVKADGPVFNYWGFYLYRRVTDIDLRTFKKVDRYIMVRLGHKIEPRYNGQIFEGDRTLKAWKGSTFRIALRSPRP